MARVAWNFAGYDWPVNPEKDSEWKMETMNSEYNPLDGIVSHFQFTARKSARRSVTGWLIGPLASQQLTNMREWRDSKRVATLRDHVGQERRCFLMTLELEPIMNAVAWKAGQQVYRYSAEFVEA